jgi:hypothetical protein
MEEEVETGSRTAAEFLGMVELGSDVAPELGRGLGELVQFHPCRLWSLSSPTFHSG